jgi:hypothetical protein
MKKSLKLINYQNLLRSVILFCLLFAFESMRSQTTSAGLGNAPSIPGFDFLGWNPSVNDDIRIRHLTPSQPILFGTNGVERMRISPNVNRSVMINAPAPNNAKLRITQMRGDGAVQAELENMDGNNLNRALRVGSDIPT